MVNQDNDNIPNDQQAAAGQEIPEVQNELSKVATNPKQSIAILAVISLVFVFIFYKLFFASDKPAPIQTTATTPTEVSKPIQDNSQNLPDIPKLPVAPELEVPVQLPPPPPTSLEKPVEQPNVPLPTPIDSSKQVSSPPPLVSQTTPSTQLVISDEEKKRREAKRKSSIVLIGGAPPKKTAEQIAEEAAFHKRGDMHFVLAKGKIIEAVLETAINSDLKGEIRAVISRDVFAEQGKLILIPKGSKVFGTYATSAAYGRIDIIWNRIDLSNGYTITLDGTGVDNLGRKGDQGRVDNKFKERLTNAVLLSAFNIGVAAGLDKLVPPVIDSQASATAQAEANSIQQIASTANTNPSVEASEVARVCAEVLSTISDKTSPAYASMQSACNTAQSSNSAQPGQNLTLVKNAAFAASNSLLTNAATASSLTQQQEASKQAFTDLSNTVKDMITQQEFKPTTTIDQGTVVKIYVNKDYKFPQSALVKVRLIK